jgi:hypothetical protein
VARDDLDAPLPLLERRWEEDELSATLYQDVPFRSANCLALTHSLIKRGLVDPEVLKARMKEVHERLPPPEGGEAAFAALAPGGCRRKRFRLGAERSTQRNGAVGKGGAGRFVRSLSRATETPEKPVTEK